MTNHAFPHRQGDTTHSARRAQAPDGMRDSEALSLRDIQIRIALDLLAQERFDDAIQAVSAFDPPALPPDDERGFPGLLVLVEAHLAVGQLEHATEAAEQLLDRMAFVTDERLIARARVAAGAVASRLGHANRARRLLTQGLVETRALGLEQPLLQALRHLAQCLAQLGERRASLTYHLEYAALKAQLDQESERRQITALWARHHARQGATPTPAPRAP